jgi:hypothetical protein
MERERERERVWEKPKLFKIKNSFLPAQRSRIRIEMLMQGSESVKK